MIISDGSGKPGEVHAPTFHPSFAWPKRAFIAETPGRERNSVRPEIASSRYSPAISNSSFAADQSRVAGVRLRFDCEGSNSACQRSPTILKGLSETGRAFGGQLFSWIVPISIPLRGQAMGHCQSLATIRF